MKILITGGLGYVGGRLTQYFSGLPGHQVIALSRKADKVNINFPGNITVVHPKRALEDQTLLASCDVVIHLASLNEIDCVKFPYEAIQVNVSETLQWLSAAQEAGVKKFVYFSTAHVYRKPLSGFFDENSKTEPLHPYSITHKSAEDYVLMHHYDKKMHNVIIRLTNAFGGPAFPTADRWTLLVNDLCKSAVEKGTMSLTSDGTQLRDFVCLHDVCTAVHHLILSDVSGSNPVYNVGGGKSISVWEMASAVKRVAEKYLVKPIPLTRKEPAHDVESDALSISINKLTATGFRLGGDVDREILSTLEYFKHYRS